jgi:hypothetical protein
VLEDHGPLPLDRKPLKILGQVDYSRRLGLLDTVLIPFISPVADTAHVRPSPLTSANV